LGTRPVCGKEHKPPLVFELITAAAAVAVAFNVQFFLQIFFVIFADIIAILNFPTVTIFFENRVVGIAASAFKFACL
jgi:hypothetical protein